MRILLVLSLLFLTGCGYRLGHGGFGGQYRTMSVPYAIGDHDGTLTTAIIRNLSESGSYEYVNGGGNLCLQVNVVDVSEENIGFRYDRKKSGKLTDSIIPSETRITAVAEVTVVDNSTGCPLVGPVLLSASVDFDHDYYNSRNGINVFSLGQLSDYDEAYDTVQTPLNEALATKIVDYVNGCW